MDNLIQSAVNKIKKFAQNITPQVQKFTQPFQDFTQGARMAQNTFNNAGYNQIAKPYIQNQYIKPVQEIPKQIQNKQYLGAGMNALKLGVNVIQPLAGLAFQGYEGLKAQGEARLQGQSIPQSLESMRQGFVGDKYTGLGSSLTKNPLMAKVGNVAEVAVPLVAGAYGAYKGVKNLMAIKESDMFVQNMKTKELLKIPSNLKNKFKVLDNEGLAMGKDWHVTSGLSPTKIERGGLKVVGNADEKVFDTLKSKIEYTQPKVIEPKVKVVNSKVKVKMTPIKTNINEQSGLPPEGLSAQPAKKTRIITSLYNRTLNESRNVLNNMGEGGRNMSRRIDNMYQTAQREAGTAVADLQQITNKFDDVGHGELINELRSGIKNYETNNVRKILDKVYTDAKKVGLDLGYRENYVPQMIDPKKLATNKNLAIEHFVETKQFPTVERATQFIDDIINGVDIKEAYNRFGKPLPKKMGNLEFQRILDWVPEVLRNDKKLIPDYLEQAYTRINQIKQFGKNGEIGTNLLNNINKQGYDTKLAQQIYDQNLGLVRYNRQFQKASGLVRSAQGAMKLPLAAITNATQSVNTATVGGTKRTLGQIFRYANPAERKVMEEYSLRTGATLNGEMQQILEQWKGGKNPLEKLIAPFFGKVENFNRVIASNVGREKALSEGVTNAEELLKAGQSMVDKTQFQVRPIDMPVSWNTPGGKLATQFKSFGFRQAGFVKNEIIDKVMKGDLKPLARFLLIGTIINEVANDAKAFLSRKERPQDFVERIISDLPGLGYYQDAVETIAYGLKYPGGLFPAIFDFVAGPTGSDLRQATNDIGSLAGGNAKPLAKDVVGNIPFIGRPMINENPQLFGGKTKVTSTQQDVGTSQTGSDTTLLEKQKLKDQISELEKQKKSVYEQAGVNVPFVGNFGSMTDQEKIQKMTDLENQITSLESKKKLMDIKIELPKRPVSTGQAELDKKLMSKYSSALTTEINDAIKLFEAGQITAQEANNIIASIKNEQNQVKVSRPKKVAIKKVSGFKVKKVTAPKSFKVKAIKSPKIKTLKSKFKVKKTKQPKIKVKIPKLPKFG